MVKDATRSGVRDDTVSLKVLIDKEKNKVVFAEAGQDFADVLLSFLTLPLGTIVRLVAKESSVQPVKVGSLSTLYESVSLLEEKFLCIQEYKEMLLQPRNSMEHYCKQLMLNIDDTELKSYCNLLNCACDDPQSEFFLEAVMRTWLEKGFVKESASLLVCDDLYIMPNDFGASANLFHMLGIEDLETLEEQIVDITKEEVCHFLTWFLCFHSFYSLVCLFFCRR